TADLQVRSCSFGPEDHDHERRGVAQSQRLTPRQLQVRDGGADEELRAGFAADAEALLERLHARARRFGELAPGRGAVELLQETLVVVRVVVVGTAAEAGAVGRGGGDDDAVGPARRRRDEGAAV